MFNKPIIGLTGGIGSGKSTVGKQFKQLGIVVVDEDLCSRIVVEPGTKALNEIATHFGQEILLQDGNLDRAKLRKIIFDAPNEKQWLEELLHPLIFEEIVNQLQSATSPYAILESPLLIEAKQSDLCDKVIVVDANKETQIKRTLERDSQSSRETVEAIINSQASREERLKQADFILDNNDCSLSLLKTDICKIHDTLLSLEKTT